MHAFWISLKSSPEISRRFSGYPVHVTGFSDSYIGLELELYSIRNFIKIFENFFDFQAERSTATFSVT